MKQYTKILIKAFCLVFMFVLLLGAGILSLSYLHGGVRQNDNEFLTPEHAVAAPTAQELLQQKFDTYNTVTEENGKRVVTIFNEEQIKNLNTRRNNGEWFWLSSEEMLFLIDDTVKLFEEYDIVRIWTSDERTREFDRGYNTKNVYEVILERVRVLNSATFNTLYVPTQNVYKYIAMSDCKNKLSMQEMAALDACINPWYGQPDTQRDTMVLWAFGEDIIHFWKQDTWSQYEFCSGYYFWKARTQIYPKK